MDLNNNKKKIWVFGGANIDLLGRAINPLVEYDSNIGQITISQGGVGRNIAQSIAMTLGDYGQVFFVTAFSDDEFGRMLKADCESHGINCDYSLVTDTHPTSIYLALMDETGDMRIAMSDMEILDVFDQNIIRKILKDISPEDLVVADLNYPEELLEVLIKECSSRIIVDPISIAKTKKIANHLGELYIFKPNQIEAKTLNGIEIVDEKTARDSLKWFIDKGVNEILITLGEKGVLLGIKETEELYWFTHRKISLTNATGGGDTFLGSYVSSRVHGMTPMESVEFAIGAAIDTIESHHSVSKTISRESIANMIKSAEIKYIKL